MKVLILLFALVTLVWGAEFQAIAEYNQRSVSSQVENAIVDARDQMPCGYPAFGIPPLAPLQTAQKDISIDFDGIQAFGEVSDFSLFGLDDFDIIKLKINILLSRANFKFNWNHVYLSTNYNVSTAKNDKGIKRSGPAQFAIKDLTAWGVFKYHYGLISQKLTVKELSVYFSLGEVKSDIGGLSEINFINEKLNRIIEEWIMMTVNESGDKIAELTNSLVVPRLNDILSNKTLSDVLVMMNNRGNINLPNEKHTCVPPQQNSE